MSKYGKRMPLWLKILLGIIGVGALFCLIVLVYGGCVGWNFIEVLQHWFTPDKFKQIEENKEPIENAVTAAISILR